ncbi:hypothetical protein FQN57_001935 [Myotisia sp. PD_48]|nr:hypothetical protein FQN57_001935 [Myotisia sp. PD_48]
MGESSKRGQRADIAQTIERIQHLHDIFRRFDTTLQARKFGPDEQGLIDKIESSTKQCLEIILELKDKCQKFESSEANDRKGSLKLFGRRATYPFRESTLRKLDEDISYVRDDILLALNVLHLGDNAKMHNNIADIKSLLQHIEATQISSTIRDWLRALDVTLNYNSACTKRHPRTGACDESKRDESAMVRTLLLQLASQVRDGHSDLERLKNTYGPGIPPMAALIEYFRHLIRRFHNVFILLDALDECPRYAQHDRILETIDIMRKWEIPGLHLLVASRDEIDIREALCTTNDQELVIKNMEIDEDIKMFISSRLNTDPQLCKLRVHHSQIYKSLAERAHGVFRWVECQLEILKKCPRSPHHIRRCLKTLPRSLDETYERMLCNINKDLFEDVRQLLTLVCFSTKPLTVAELIDGIAVDLEEPVCFNIERRLQDEDNIRKICPGLIDIGFSEERANRQHSIPVVQIAHFPVQEYLKSERIAQSKAAKYAMKSQLAHRDITKICLVYLLEPSLNNGFMNQTKTKEFPFASFAARFWHQHYANITSNRAKLDGLELELFKEHRKFYNWVKLYDIDQRWSSPNYDTDVGRIAAPLYYASSRCYKKVVQMLLDGGADVNTQGGKYGNALQAASFKGYKKVVQMLLDSGADVNTQGGYFRNALQI